MMVFDKDTFLPRMNVAAVPGALADRHGLPPDECIPESFDLRRGVFHPRGTTQTTIAQLREWQSSLSAWAYDNGFPAAMNESARSRWDVALGTRLRDDVGEIPELFHPEVWCWLATELLPHFVVHRWGWPKPEEDSSPVKTSAWRRFSNRPENGLRLALQRVIVFGEELALEATEQEFQSLKNRPAFGSDARVARITLEALVSAVDDNDSNYGKNGGTRALDANHVCIELRLLNSLRPLCFMSDDQVRLEVLQVIERLPELRAE